MTKFFEEFIRTDVDKLEVFDFELKGELTIVISEKKDDKNTSHQLSESDKSSIKNMINKTFIKHFITSNQDLNNFK